MPVIDTAMRCGFELKRELLLQGNTALLEASRLNYSPVLPGRSLPSFSLLLHGDPKADAEIDVVLWFSS